MIFRYTTGLYQLNLEIGKFEALLNPNSISDHYFSYAFSPNGRYLVFANEIEKNIFYIRDMHTGRERKFELNSKIENIGDFVWTRDGLKVIFVAGLNGWYYGKAGTSLYTFDTQTSTIDILLYDDEEQRVPFFDWSLRNSDWLNSNMLHLISAQKSFPDWFIDIRTGYVAPMLTYTPHP